MVRGACTSTSHTSAAPAVSQHENEVRSVRARHGMHACV